MRPRYIPVLVKHCTLAIYHDPKTHITARNKKDRFEQCLMIARSRLQQYGFITLLDSQIYGEISLTDKGRLREQKHLAEGRAKTVMFDTIFRYFDIDGSEAEARKKKAAKAKELREDAKDRKRP